MLTQFTPIPDFHPDDPEPSGFTTYDLSMPESEWIIACDILTGMGAHRAVSYLAPCIADAQSKPEAERGYDPWLIITVPQDRVNSLRFAVINHLHDRVTASAQAEAIIKEHQHHE